MKKRIMILIEALIAFDILFVGNVSEEGDTAFADACRESGNVVTVNQLIYGDRLVENSQGEMVRQVKSVSQPYDALKETVEVGYSNVAQDSGNDPHGQNRTFHHQLFGKARRL